MSAQFTIEVIDKGPGVLPETGGKGQATPVSSPVGDPVSKPTKEWQQAEVGADGDPQPSKSKDKKEKVLDAEVLPTGGGILKSLSGLDAVEGKMQTLLGDEGLGGILRGLGASEGQIASLAASAGPAAIAVGAVAVALAGVGAVAGATVVSIQALKGAVAELTGIDADINQAVAETDVQRMQTLFERSDRIGPELAEFERVRRDIEKVGSEAQTLLLEAILKIFTELKPAIEGGVALLRDSLKAVEDNKENIASTAEASWTIAKYSTTAARDIDAILKFLAWWGDKAESEERIDESSRFLDRLLRSAEVAAKDRGIKIESKSPLRAGE